MENNEATITVFTLELSSGAIRKLSCELGFEFLRTYLSDALLPRSSLSVLSCNILTHSREAMCGTFRHQAVGECALSAPWRSRQHKHDNIVPRANARLRRVLLLRSLGSDTAGHWATNRRNPKPSSAFRKNDEETGDCGNSRSVCLGNRDACAALCTPYLNDRSSNCKIRDSKVLTGSKARTITTTEQPELVDKDSVQQPHCASLCSC